MTMPYLEHRKSGSPSAVEAVSWRKALSYFFRGGIHADHLGAALPAIALAICWIVMRGQTTGDAYSRHGYSALIDLLTMIAVVAILFGLLLLVAAGRSASRVAWATYALFTALLWLSPYLV